MCLSACSKANSSSNCNGEKIIGSFIDIPSGSFTKSQNPVYPEEGLPSIVEVKGFKLQTHETTTQQFAEFVKQSNYVTDAEKSSQSTRADGGSAFFKRSKEMNESSWELSKEVSWRKPEGSNGNETSLNLYPAVHISHNDAQAYAKWAGGRLPTEIEWEYASSLGLPDPENTYSSAYDKNGIPIANTWQGIFPVIDSGRDGFKGTAPIGCFPANKLGLYDMIGNVWEWTATEFNENNYTIKGGSHLCASNYCSRYRPGARQPMEKDFSSNHIGFRIVK